ncbi:galactose-3-O-sulfotransferase 2-like [Mizuhopecten yessoensis]|uniref:Galactose-3-O-sulfotransferase 3 n=1 Tax=Mizuhopecten yessoensis TaxID=6573 RepID=A0A210PQ17_MIZYE|nr:galactose-3-O-sulfotransferase 2-like [Mizuhopecten yessoensis]OWF38599.1 Galactose-3-O-sulfotransferase 3 [Mizuhopecten yessoensis]
MPRFWFWVRLLGLAALVYTLRWLIFDTKRVDKYGGFPRYMREDHHRFDQFCLSKTKDDTFVEIESNRRQIDKPEARHIVFLKVHKAASSTVQNIFLRFGAIRDLVFMLPKSNSNVISLTNSVSEQNVLRSPTGKVYDILCCHVIYNKSAMQTFMPKDTVYVGIVRHPFEQFLSTINYFRPVEFFNIAGPHKAKTFLRNPTKYVSRAGIGNFLDNRMAYEFNFPRTLFIDRTEDEIQTYLRKLDQEFTIVLVADYLDESIILMRRLLGWKLKDILHGRVNTGKRRSAKVPKMETITKELHKHWAELDYALYDYFSKRLFDRIKLEGPGFQSELLYFKRVQRDVQSFCFNTYIYNINVRESIAINKSPWNERFEITSLDCIYMNINENIFIQEVRHRQYLRQSLTNSTV